MKHFGHCLALVAASTLGGTSAFAQAVSPIEYESNTLAGARLGVAIATLGELADAPELLARPSSQAFVDDTFARIARTDDAALRERLKRRRDALRAGDAAFDPHLAYAAVAALAKDELAEAGASGAPLVALGIVAEQTSYNARVLHDATADAQDRAALGNDAQADPFVPHLHELRAALAAAGPHTWAETASSAQAIVAGILGSGSAVPFPSSPAVWLVVLRVRATNADARRRAAHYFLDVVRYDGTHRTIGAYPDGGLVFDRDTAHLICAVDREPDDAVLRTLPVQPGPASTSADLARALERGCTAARGDLRYRVVSADDDRFLADLLFRSGVSVAPLLRAAAAK